MYSREASRVDRNLPIKRIAGAAQAQLPVYMRLDSGVFFSENAGILLENMKYDHARHVETGKEPPSGPLYNLSQTELKVLQEYLGSTSRRA
jgi:hypothetical protein